MKMVKLCPAPHVEVCVHVTAGMEKDLRECQQMEPLPEEGWKDCGQCSWNGVAWLDTGFCCLLGVREAASAEKEGYIQACEDFARELWMYDREIAT